MENYIVLPFRKKASRLTIQIPEYINIFNNIKLKIFILKLNVLFKSNI